jgi:hypothetical protein
MLAWLGNELIQVAMWACAWTVFLFFFDVRIRRRRR